MTNPSDMYRRNIKSRVDKPPFCHEPLPPRSCAFHFEIFNGVEIWSTYRLYLQMT